MGFQLVFECNVVLPPGSCLGLNFGIVDAHGFLDLDTAVGLVLAVSVVVSEPLVHFVKTDPAALVPAAIKFCCLNWLRRFLLLMLGFHVLV